MILSDIVICGGALSGLTAALALQKLNMKILIIDPLTIEEIIKKDKRTTAIAAGPGKFYLEKGVWQLLEGKAESINKINIKDGNSGFQLDFDYNEIKESLRSKLVTNLGYVVENSYLLQSINNIIKNNGKKTPVKRIKAKVISIEKKEEDLAKIKLDNGKIVLASLIIAADGRNSVIRKMSGIEEKKLDYEQYAFVCQIQHKNFHQNIALEKFLPGGPLAILPMIKNEKSYRSSIIWSDNKEVSMGRFNSARHDPKRIAYELERHSFEWLGRIESLSSSAVYPLQLIRAKNVVAERFVLIGDAAHGLHPIAGQGFNLTIRDIKIFTELCKKRVLLGLDIGSEKFLKDYEKIRRADILGLVLATHSLNKLFSIKKSPIKLFRKVGMSAIQKSPYIKRIFMRYAMGL